jgi:SulP family sulfate permease
VPALGSLATYGPGAAGRDLVAGLTVAAVAVPQALAYALVAGLPPEHGLYTAIVMTAVGALFDSSRLLINGPTNAISIAVLSALALVPEGARLEAAFTLALLVGAIQASVGLLRLGELTRYVSHSVIVGFTAGASILLILDQLKNLLGIPAAGQPTDHFLVRFVRTYSQGAPIHGWTLALGLGSMAAVVALRWVNERWLIPRGRLRIPELLLALVGATAVTSWLGLASQGVTVVGTVPSGLPSFHLPELPWHLVRELTGSAAAIALLGLLEAVAMAKALAGAESHRLDVNQQCLSEGFANLAGGCFRCFPGSGSLTRSAINQQSGAVSQWSGVVSAGAVALTIIFLAPLAKEIPRAALAGILVLTALRMVDLRQVRYFLRASRIDTTIIVATAISAVAVSVEFCIVIGTFLSFVMYVPRASRIHATELVVAADRVVRERTLPDAPCSKLRMYDLEGEFFFGAVADLHARFDEIMAALPGARVLVLRVKRVRNPDGVCLHALDDFVSRVQRRGVTVILCGARAELAQALEASGIAPRLGIGGVLREGTEPWSSTLEAVRRAYAILGDDLCPQCPRRRDHQARSAPESWYYVI